LTPGVGHPGRNGRPAETITRGASGALAYRIYRCWPSLYQALPPLDPSSAEGAIEQTVLENEDWERDAAVVGPVEPS
jgi:hypothetical protein